MAQAKAQRLDFENTVERLLQCQEKLRKEQQEFLLKKIAEAKVQPKEDRSGLKLLLSIVPALGGVTFGLLNFFGITPQSL